MSNVLKMKQIKIHTVLHILVFLLLPLLCCCIDEQDKPEVPVGDSEKIVTFSLQIQRSSSLKTYALTRNDEDEVRTIAILLFDENKKYIHQPIYCNTITSDLAFTVKIPKGTYDVVVLANANSSLADILGNIHVGDAKSDVLNKLVVINSGEWNTDVSSSSYTLIPMWGEIQNCDVGTVSSASSIKLLRMLSKIDVILSTDAQANFNLKSVRLYNYMDRGKLVPDAVDWNSTNIVNDPSIPSLFNKLGNPLKSPVTASLKYDGNAIEKDQSGRGISCTDEIYTFEAVAGTASTLSENTCFVIGGYYKDDVQETFYRVDIANITGGNNKFLPLLRNSNYKININKVSDRGFNSPDEAFNSNPMNIQAGVVMWNDGRYISFEINDDYLLGVSKSSFTFMQQGRNNTSNDNDLSIITDYPGGWIIDKIVGEDGNPVSWLSCSRSAGSSPQGDNIKLIVDQYDNGTIRTAFIHIKAERLIYIVKVVQQYAIIQPKANCYIVAPNAQGILIPASRANDSMLGEQLDANDAFTAELVWTDNAKGIAANSNISEVRAVGVGKTNGYIYVNPGSSEGNAVVCIKDLTGTILWSWHIWVISSKPTAGGNGRMDRNLGALTTTSNQKTTMGLLYQWGRKDPFPGSLINNGSAEPVIYNALGVSRSVIKNSSTSNFGNSVAMPDNFYSNWSGSSSWSSPKTVYDPCPDGWHVAKYGDWFSNIIWANSFWTVNGMNFYGVYYPAAGGRNNNGDIYDVGKAGYYWTQNPSQSFTFDNSYISQEDYSGRKAYGYSIRCVSGG